MTDAVRAATLSLPAGNGSTAIFFTPVELGWAEVTEILVQFPPGCAGLVGVRLEYTQHPVYPIDGTGWYTFDDFNLVIPVSNQGNSGSWRLVGYNADYNPHVIKGFFSYNWTGPSAQQGASPLVSL